MLSLLRHRTWQSPWGLEGEKKEQRSLYNTHKIKNPRGHVGDGNEKEIFSFSLLLHIWNGNTGQKSPPAEWLPTNHNPIAIKSTHFFSLFLILWKQTWPCIASSERGVLSTKSSFHGDSYNTISISLFIIRAVLLCCWAVIRVVEGGSSWTDEGHGDYKDLKDSCKLSPASPLSLFLFPTRVGCDGYRIRIVGRRSGGGVDLAHPPALPVGG